MKWFQAVNQQSSDQCRSGRQLIDLLSKRIVIFRTTSGKRKLRARRWWEREYSTASRVVEGHCNTECEHCVYMELRSEWVSFCAVFFHSVTRACTKKKRFFLKPNGYFTTEFPRRWKEALHIEPACKLQVTPPSRGRYQNKGPCEAEVSAGSGPQAAGSGPTPTKPVAPDFIDCAIQKNWADFNFPQPAWGLAGFHHLLSHSHLDVSMNSSSPTLHRAFLTFKIVNFINNLSSDMSSLSYG